MHKEQEVPQIVQKNFVGKFSAPNWKAKLSPYETAPPSCRHLQPLFRSNCVRIVSGVLPGDCHGASAFAPLGSRGGANSVAGGLLTFERTSGWQSFGGGGGAALVIPTTPIPPPLLSHILEAGLNAHGGTVQDTCT